MQAASGSSQPRSGWIRDTDASIPLRRRWSALTPGRGGPGFNNAYAPTFAPGFASGPDLDAGRSGCMWAAELPIKSPRLAAVNTVHAVFRRNCCAAFRWTGCAVNADRPDIPIAVDGEVRSDLTVAQPFHQSRLACEARRLTRPPKPFRSRWVVTRLALQRGIMPRHRGRAARPARTSSLAAKRHRLVAALGHQAQPQRPDAWLGGLGLVEHLRPGIDGVPANAGGVWAPALIAAISCALASR